MNYKKIKKCTGFPDMLNGQESGSGKYIRGLDGGGRHIDCYPGGLGGSRFFIMGPGIGGGSDNSSGNKEE